MNDTMHAVNRLERELYAAGVGKSAAIPTIYTYIGALHDGKDASWRAFYMSVYERLAELASRDYPYAGGPAEPLLRLLDDDFGTTLVSEAERKRIRRALVEYGRSEASLPS